MEIPASILQHAEMLFSKDFQTPVRLEVLDRFDSSHIVLRCAIHTGEDHRQIPASIILKQRNLIDSQPNQQFDQGLLFRNEWAALDFLTACAPEGGTGPRLYASDCETGLVLLEDLGTAPTVQDALYGSDPRLAAEALAATGTFLGRMQRLTYHREPEFTARQQSLGAATVLSDASLDCRNFITELRACLEALRIDPHPDFESALHALEEAIHGPGAFRTFVHNDAGAHNYVITPTGTRLLDFEFAGFGHGLLDVVCARLAFPPSFRGRLVPTEVVDDLERRYRLEVANGIPALQDEDRFTEALSQACAHWAFSKLIGFWNNYLRDRLAEGESRDTRDGRDPARAAFFRRQVFTYLRLALATLQEKQQLPVIRAVLAQIVEQLLSRWRVTPLLDTFPTFGGEPWHYP